MMIATQEQCRVYEHPLWRDVTGDTLRPGGLALTQWALALCALPSGARVLDVGCGIGTTVQYARAEQHLAAIGIDYSAALLQRGRQRHPHLPLLRAAGEHLPIVAAAIDAVVAECSLSVLADRDQALAEFHRVLQPGGWLVVSDIYARNPEGVPALRGLPPEICISGALSQQHITRQLQAHSFQLEIWEDHSETLKHVVARMILSRGSQEEFWRQTTHVDPFDIQLAIARARPGYYLLVARKHAP